MPTILRHRWLLPSVLLVGFALGLTGFVASQQGDNKAPTAKEARPGVAALLFVARRAPQALDDGRQAPLDPGELEEFRRTQLAMIRSRFVLNGALRDSAVAKLPAVKQQTDAVAWLEKHLHAEYLKGTGVLRLSFGAGTPTEQATVVNATADAYLREVANSERQQKITRLKRLKTLYDDYEHTLRNKRDTLHRLARDLGSKDARLLKLKEQMARTQLQALQKELLEVESQLRRAKIKLAILDKQDQPPPQEAAVKELIEKDTVVARLHQELWDLKNVVEYFKARSANPENEPPYKRALSQIEAKTKSLAAQRDSVRPNAVAQAREQAGAGQRATRARLKERITFLEALQRELREDIQRRSMLIIADQRDTVDLQWLREEIAQVEEVFRQIVRQKQRLEVEIDAPPRVQIIERATAPK